MKKISEITLITLVVCVVIAVLVGFISIYLFGPENKVEQISESVIDKITGVEVDLSPPAP